MSASFAPPSSAFMAPCGATSRMIVLFSLGARFVCLKLHHHGSPQIKICASVVRLFEGPQIPVLGGKKPEMLSNLQLKSNRHAAMSLCAADFSTPFGEVYRGSTARLPRIAILNFLRKRIGQAGGAGGRGQTPWERVGPRYNPRCGRIPQPLGSVLIRARRTSCKTRDH
jgi:hypothetical protein